MTGGILAEDYADIPEVIPDLRFKRPHVVILGAGASRAAATHSTADLKPRLPLMDDFVETLGLEGFLRSRGVPNPRRNIEDVFSELSCRPEQAGTLRELEHRIHDYFTALPTLSEPSLYDLLVLSLRDKDYIASFNWDPYLFRACSKASKYVPVPKPLFLHGNVAVGYCVQDRYKGHVGAACPKCRKRFLPSQLLYPIARKDYSAHPSISAEWEAFSQALANAYCLTIFGYSAPTTDAEAMRLMKQAWGDVEQRDLEQTSIIDVKPEDELTETWTPFIHTHHYGVCASFHESWIARHPRRTCEALWSAVMDQRPHMDHPLPTAATYQDLLEALHPYVDAETTSG